MPGWRAGIDNPPKSPKILIFKFPHQIHLYDIWFENSDQKEHSGEKIIEIGRFLTELWSFEDVWVG